jgi:hypothetical protein
MADEDQGLESDDEGVEDEAAPNAAEVAMTVLTHEPFLQRAEQAFDKWLVFKKQEAGDRKSLGTVKAVCGSVVLLGLSGGIVALLWQGHMTAAESLPVLLAIVSGAVFLLRSA